MISEEGRRQRAEGRRMQYSLGFRPRLIASHQIKDFGGGLKPLLPSVAGRGQEAEFPSAFCLLPSAFLVKTFAAGLSQLLLVPATLLAISMGATSKVVAQSKLYNPIPLPASNEFSDTLSEKDIPTGQGGFARDYMLTLKAGDNLAIDLSSDSFDSIVTLLASDGTTISENDDGPDGTTNSLLFSRITKPGSYIIRVRAFGETGVGAFKLRVTRLRPL